jgi:phosphinothricin acetyltransferase
VSTVIVEGMTAAHADAVLCIYGEGLATGTATFETTVPSWGEWDREHIETCRLVARDGNEVLGWAALSPVSDRCVYGGVAELGVYVAAAARGRGVGKALLNALVRASEGAGYWTLQAGIFAENTVSIALHHACGFRTVGTRERLGQLQGVWRDVLLLERRSNTVGA